MGKIWVKRRVGPFLAWGHNKDLCRAVEWSSCSRTIQTTDYNANSYYDQLLSPVEQYQRSYLNRNASESAFWNSRHHPWGP